MAWCKPRTKKIWQGLKQAPNEQHDEYHDVRAPEKSEDSAMAVVSFDNVALELAKDISGEIDERMEQELQAGLDFSYHDRRRSSSFSLDSSIFAYPQRPARNAHGHGGQLPVRLLDTSDMVKFLAEKKHRGRSSTLAAVPSSDVPSSEEAHVSTKKNFAGRTMTTTLTFVSSCKTAILLVVVTLLLGMLAVCIYLAFQYLVQAALEDAFLNLHAVQIDELTRDSFHLVARGIFSNVNLRGSLESAEYLLSSSPASSHPIGRITLPTIQFGQGKSVPILLDQAIVIDNKNATIDMFASFANTDAQFSLRGSPVVSWRGLKTRLQIKSMNIYLQAMEDAIKFSSNNTFSLDRSSASDYMVFRSNFTVENQSPIALNLGKVDLELRFEDDMIMQGSVANASLEARSNAWQFEAEIPQTNSSGATAASIFLSVLSSASRAEVQLVPISSSFNDHHQPFTSVLAQGLSGAISFITAMPPHSSLNATKAMLHGDLNASTRLLTLNYSSDTSLPYPMRQKSVSNNIDSLELYTLNKTLLGKMVGSLSQNGSGTTTIRTDQARAFLDSQQTIQLSIVNLTLLTKLLESDENANKQIYANGTFSGVLDTMAGLVSVNNLPIDTKMSLLQ